MNKDRISEGLQPIRGGRKFYDIPIQHSVNGNATFYKSERNNQCNPEEFVRYISSNIIGNDATFVSPFGRRRIVYCDHVASGRSVNFIEDFLRKEVLPFYGNTHTTTSVTSLQTTLFRHEARDIFRNATNAAEEDAVIFTGSGTTAAVHKLINAMSLHQNQSRVIVFTSIQEHHSNLLPWRELPNSEIRSVPDNLDGTINEDYLMQELMDISQQYSASEESRPIMVGCFPAASNVTGILNDDIAITALLHQYGALSFWDYATAAPHTYIDVNPKVVGDIDGLCKKDAIYFSCHKFLGGVQAPGVLIAKKKLFNNPKPDGGGGGSVFFVTEKDHRYLKETELREEGGTPAIVESVRAGLAMQLKQSVGMSYIAKREHELMKLAKQKLSNIPNFHLLGNGFVGGNHHNLPILSFLITAPSQSFNSLFLHHNYVSAILNDLFGIQSRGGCACAGPFAQYLLGISSDLAKQYESILMEDERLDRRHLRRGHSEYSQFEVLRPGFTRLNLSWFSSDDEINFILDALIFIAEHGWKIMPQYKFNNETGEWRHHTNQVFRERRWLGNISYENGRFSYDPRSNEEISPTPDIDNCDYDNFEKVMINAHQIVSEAPKIAQKLQVPDQTILFQDEAEKLRWMILPYEAKEMLVSKSNASISLKVNAPFTPLKFLETESFQNKDHSNSDNIDMCIGSLLSKSVKAPSNYLKKLYPMVENKNKANSKSQDMVLENRLASPELSKNVSNGSSMSCEDGSCVLPEGRRKTIENNENVIPKSKCRWQPPTKDIFKPFLEAVEEFKMIKDGDRVLVCLSGGKDSLSLLHTLRQYQFYAGKQSTNPIKFELGALTVDPLSSAYDPRPLIPYLAELGVPYLYEEQAIMKQALEANCSSICAFCSRMKRGRMYAAARRGGWNTLALGQHLDDLAESFLMSVFHNGRLRTMKANYTVNEGDLKIIRPFVYTREKQLRVFAETRKLPVIAENCPACFESPKERHRVKQVLAQQELLFPRLYWSLKSAMHPAMNVNRTGIESELFGKSSVNTRLNIDKIESDEDDF